MPSFLKNFTKRVVKTDEESHDKKVGNGAVGFPEKVALKSTIHWIKINPGILGLQDKGQKYLSKFGEW